MPTASESVSLPQPVVEPKPLAIEEPTPSLPQEKSPDIESQEEHSEAITEAQQETEKAIALAKAQQTEKAALKKAAVEKQKQLEKERQREREKQQKLQVEIQQQLEKEQQQKNQVQVKKQQKEIERFLQQDLVQSSSVKSSVRSAQVVSKANHASTGVDNKEIDRYKSLIISAISHQWIVPENVKKGLECRLKVRVAPAGVVMDVKLLKASGDAALDRSAEAAIYKASPLPVPKEAALFNEFREFNLTVRPEGILAG
jgi:colicin import membrane protein